VNTTLTSSERGDISTSVMCLKVSYKKLPGGAVRRSCQQGVTDDSLGANSSPTDSLLPRGRAGKSESTLTNWNA